MAQIEENTGERSINADVNIVPFIDLMSVCIIFLLLTAVWTQVSMIQIGSSVYGKRTDPGQLDPPPRPEISFRVEVLPAGYVVRLGRNAFQIPKVNDEFDQKTLIDELKKIKEKYPDKNDAMIAVSEELNYEDLINGMDSLLIAGFPEVAIQTGGVK